MHQSFLFFFPESWQCLGFVVVVFFKAVLVQQNFLTDCNSSGFRGKDKTLSAGPGSGRHSTSRYSEAVDTVLDTTTTTVVPGNADYLPVLTNHSDINFLR